MFIIYHILFWNCFIIVYEYCGFYWLKHYHFNVFIKWSIHNSKWLFRLLQQCLILCRRRGEPSIQWVLLYQNIGSVNISGHLWLVLHNWIRNWCNNIYFCCYMRYNRKMQKIQREEKNIKSHEEIEEIRYWNTNIKLK